MTDRRSHKKGIAHKKAKASVAQLYLWCQRVRIEKRSRIFRIVHTKSTINQRFKAYPVTLELFKGCQ